MEYPIEPVVVIAYGSDPRKDQFPRTPGIILVVVSIKVLPEKTAISFIESRRARNLKRNPGLVSQGCIKESGIRRRVRLRFQGVGVTAHAVLALIEGVAEIPSV